MSILSRCKAIFAFAKQDFLAPHRRKALILLKRRLTAEKPQQFPGSLTCKGSNRIMKGVLSFD